VGTDDVVESIESAESARDVSAPEMACTTVATDESASLDGVRPKEIWDRSIAGGLGEAVESGDLIDSLDLGRQSSMNAEDAIVNEGSKREVIENLVQHLPDARISVVAVALGPEAVELVDGTTFVVSTQHGHSVRVESLVTEQELNDLDAVGSTVDEISQKQVLSLGQRSTYMSNSY
jgi:hypothetical protein